MTPRLPVRLRCEHLEDRTTPATLNTEPPAPVFATGAAPGHPPEVVVYDRQSAEVKRFLAYDPAFLGGVSVAVGDITGDGVPDIVTGAGSGGGPHVKVFDGVTFKEVRSFYAYDPGFSGGVSVTVGDMTGDGAVDIITGAGPSGGPHVKVFDGTTGAEVMSFYAFAPAFRGGVSVAMTSDGTSGLVVGAGPGGGPHVKAFAAVTLEQTASFYAYDPSFAGGVNVAATGSFIMTGAMSGAPHVKVFYHSIPGVHYPNPFPTQEEDSFYAGDPSDGTGVRVGSVVFPRGREFVGPTGLQLIANTPTTYFYSVAGDGTVTRYSPALTSTMAQPEPTYSRNAEQMGSAAGSLGSISGLPGLGQDDGLFF